MATINNDIFTPLYSQFSMSQLALTFSTPQIHIEEWLKLSHKYFLTQGIFLSFLFYFYFYCILILK